MQSASNTNWRVAVKRLLAFGLLTTMTAGACGSDDPQTGLLAVAASDFHFEATDLPDAGLVEIEFSNDGAEDHHLQLLRVDDGADAEAVVEGLGSGDLSVLSQGTLVGGPGAIASGQTLTSTLSLEGGEYVMFCEIPSPFTGVPHSQQGMVSRITVDGAAEVAEIEADTTISITDDGYDIPADWDGTGTVVVVNETAGPAEGTIFRLSGSATGEDVVAFLTGEPAGPPPFGAAGGVTSLSPGRSAGFTADLAPGNYVMLSFTPGPTGAPGFVTGMLTDFTIS